MTPAISVAGLTRRYHDQVALDDVNLEIEAGSITGLLGRNGAGKTTLLRVLAGHEFPSSGSVSVLGAPPMENEHVLRRMVFVREDQAYPDFKVRHALRAASWFYPNWDAGLAPSTLTTPAEGNSWPAMMRSSVVLPAPLRPSSPVIEPGSMSKLT